MHKFQNYILLTVFFFFFANITSPKANSTPYTAPFPWWRNFLLGFVRQGTYNSCALLHPAKLYSQARAIKMCRAKLRQRTHTQSGTQTTGPKACQSFSPPPPEQSKRKRGTLRQNVAVVVKLKQLKPDQKSLMLPGVSAAPTHDGSWRKFSHRDDQRERERE